MRTHDMMQFERQRGVALFVGLIFLVVLSLIAVISMQGTVLEMRMTTNVARHEQAFEASDSLRTVPLAVFDQHVFNRGWPTSMGGSLPDDDFTKCSNASSSGCMGLSKTFFDSFKSGITKPSGTSPELLYSSLQSGEDLYKPDTWQTDVAMSICDVSSSNCANKVGSDIAIMPDGAVIAEGSGSAIAAGYRGLGSGAAGGGGSLYFEVRSIGTTPGSGRAVTASQYRQAIRN